MGVTGSKNKDMASSFDVQEKLLLDSDKSPKSFALNYLRAITCDFSIEMELGRGGYGVVYKGVSRSGKIIAVKKLFEIILKDDKTFQDEVNLLMDIKHQNIVQLIGYCAESSWETIRQPSGDFSWAEIPKRLLCFEYACNKSLRNYIFDESSGLEWNMRYEIIKGICSGLHFLHEECHIVHLDIKPENILLDFTMKPKITDFGLSKIFGSQQSRIITKNFAGTLGYMAPEYWNQGLVTSKADIFSLGVIVIEIIIGSREYPYFQQDSPDSTTKSLQQFTEKVLGKWRNKFISTPEYESVERYSQQVRQCITRALRCVDPVKEKRPTANDMIQMLNALDQTIQSLIQIINDAAGVIYCMDAHQTEPLIITGHQFGDVQIWNSDTQKVVSSVKVSAEYVTNVKFIARKGWFVAVPYDCFVRVYNYEKEMQIVWSFRADDGPQIYCSLAVHPTQPYVLTGRATEIKLWDWDQGWNCIQIFEEHSHVVTELKFSAEDTNSFASASFDGTVKVWSLDSPKSKYTLSGHSNEVKCMDFFKRDGQQYLISGSYDKTAKIWDMQKKCIHILEHTSEVHSVISHPYLPVLITGTLGGDVHVWNSTNFRLTRILKLGIGEWVRGFACLVGSGRVAAAHIKGVSVIEINS